MNLRSITKHLSLRPLALKYTVLGCGLAGLGLYRLLYATGVDGRGLLAAGHPAWAALCILSLLAGALAAWNVARFKGTVRFPRSLPGCVGCGLAAVAALFTALDNLSQGYLVYAVPAMLAAPALCAVAVCRLQGRRGNFLLHVVVCVYFALQLLKLYQFNSTGPQVQNYLFQMLACIALTVTAYQLALCDLGRGQRRWLWAAALSAGYLCLVSLGSSGTGLFLTGAAWAFTALPAPGKARKPREE